MKNLNQIPQDPLAGLKDIHLPPQPGWWPPALGWWLAAILLLAILIFLLRKWRRRQARLRPIKLALKELKTYDFAVTDATQRQLLLQQISALIRRFSLAFFPEKEVADLCGQPWLDFLCENSGSVDRVALRKTFAPLLRGPYAPTCDVNLKELEEAVTEWFKNLRRQKFKPAAGNRKDQPAGKGENP
jgi:HAMP domain-containing protein